MKIPFLAKLAVHIHLLQVTKTQILTKGKVKRHR